MVAYYMVAETSPIYAGEGQDASHAGHGEVGVWEKPRLVGEPKTADQV
jgi:hypothetical protein